MSDDRVPEDAALVGTQKVIRRGGSRRNRTGCCGETWGKSMSRWGRVLAEIMTIYALHRQFLCTYIRFFHYENETFFSHFNNSIIASLRNYFTSFDSSTCPLLFFACVLVLATLVMNQRNKIL